MTDAGSSHRGDSRARRPAASGILWALSALWALCAASPASAQGTFTRHLAITVGAGVVGGPHADFPLLVDVTDTDLRTTTNGSVQSPSGYDIVFRGEDANICGGPAPCMLDHEIELYNGATGRVLAWVRVPSLANGRVIHMYYGNDKISSSTEANGAVFDADYVGVWHLKETGNGSPNEYRDSSPYGNHGQGGQGASNATPARVGGKIGYGQRWDSTTDNVSDFIDVGQDGTLNVTGDKLTLEAWVNHEIDLAYSTGTASVLTGGTVVTFTGATLPAWVNYGDTLVFTGAPSEWLTIQSRDSASQVTLMSWSAAGVDHTNQTYEIWPAGLYGIVNHKGFDDGYRLFLNIGQAPCPAPGGALTDPCLGIGIPGHSDHLLSSQYGLPATDPVTRGSWHHVAGTYDGAEMKLYVDGQKVLAVGTYGNHDIEPPDSGDPDVCCGTIAAGGTTVNFDHALPAGVAAGQVLTFYGTPANAENFRITAVGPGNQVTVETAAAVAHTAQDYRITSPLKTGNIPPSLAEQHVWIGHGDQQQNVPWSSPWAGNLDEVRISRKARSADWIETEYANQDDPASFSTAGPGGAVTPLPLPTLTTVYRSIGTNAANLAGGGGSDRASVPIGTQVLTFTGAALPTNIGLGDRLDFTTGGAETLFILSRDSDTQVTVQTPATIAHTNDRYTITRAYNSLQTWEDALPADLVAANAREVGVAYNDGPFAAGVVISGSVTDPVRSITLTTTVAHRQRGTPGSGVVLDNGSAATPAITISDDHVTIERFEITGGSGAAAHGIEITGLSAANLSTVRYNLIHGTGGDGIRFGDADSIADVYNNFIFGAVNGIRLAADLDPSARVNVFNNTVYACTTAGITSRDAGGTRLRQTSPRVTLRNNIIHSNTSVDQDVARPFDRAYFCSGITGNDPTPGTCNAYIGHISQPNYDNQLNFSSATRCLYLGADDPFRGVAVHLAVGGTNSPDMQWDYWNGSAWSSLETGAFEDYNFQWDGFAYWADDPPSWATRTLDVDTTPRYWVRVCRASGAFGTLPTESIISRADVSVSSRYNLATDLTGYYASLWRGVGVTGLYDGGGTGVLFTSPTDLHLQAGSMARDAVLDTGRQDGGQESSALTSRYLLDVDYQARPPGADGECSLDPTACWDIGADEYAAPTAVGLMSFTAVPGDGSVTLEWRTGSELNNLGFHLYRGLSVDGPWTRLTSSLIPGLGSSPLGQAYSWLDSGLVNGTTYYYRLEDVDTSSVSTFHGPVSAAPEASAPPPPGGGGGGGDEPGGEPGNPPTGSCPSWVLAAAPDAVSPTCTKHGNPESVSLDLLSREASSATLELRTGGFWALHETTGTVRVFVPGLELPSDPHAPALPLRRALVDAVVGKQVQLVSAEAFDLQLFGELRPSAVGALEMAASRDGTVRPFRRSVSARLVSRGLVPQEVARLSGTVFQGERKSAVVEITPVRYSGRGLVLAGRVRVRLAFAGVAEGEVGTGAQGRALPRKGAFTRGVLARLFTSRRGLYAVRYEALFPQEGRGFSTALLRLQRQGEGVRFHVEPAGRVFGRGSVLYFYADREASSTDYSSEVAYELVRGSGAGMGVSVASPAGSAVVLSSTGYASFETNRIYQPGLLEAPDIWLWDAMASGSTRTEGFTLSGVDMASGDMARLVVYLQGGSESGTAVDHHVRVLVNGMEAAESTFAGRQPYRLEATLPASLLREGTNELSVVNVGDTGVYSLVFLDRFEVSYPQISTAQRGVFEGVWPEQGAVEVGGVSGPPVILRDAGDPERSAVRWLTGYEVTDSSVRFRAEAGHRYLVVSPEGLLSPRVERVPFSTLRQASNQADYLVIAPRAFLEAAAPLLERRRSQGLVSQAVAFEEIASEFGHGQPSAEAIKSFLAYAYHTWQRPSPRYVLLLGDATYDPQHFLSTSWASPLPALWEKTSYLWTASDPALGAVNGEDALPDLAIGRLPATTRAQAEELVGKVLGWEDSGLGLGGNAVLVADTPDQGGDFEADVEDIHESFLGERSTTTLRVRELGSEARPAILGAFDEGASLMSYVGHGGTAVWSSANVLNSWDAPLLRAQSRQPVLLTLNCLNGYFVAPNLDALPEALLKAEGRGVVAAFSPSGLSLDGPAHEYHRALVAELASGRHERLGDAVLAAQKTYADTGLMPELLGVYQLLGDPAMKVQ
jgi:hypothetical protein